MIKPLISRRIKKPLKKNLNFEIVSVVDIDTFKKQYLLSSVTSCNIIIIIVVSVWRMNILNIIFLNKKKIIIKLCLDNYSIIT